MMKGFVKMNLVSRIGLAFRQLGRNSRGMAFAFAGIVGLIGVAAVSPMVFANDGAVIAAAPAAPMITCDDGLAATDEQPWVRSELFFGSSKPDGTAVTDAEWRGFLDREITTRFPDGLTVLTGFGQWQEADATVVQETSRLVILLYPLDFAVESGQQIEEIRAAYEQAFQQESVLRADDADPVCTSF